MTQAFYEQLGVKSTASQGEVRTAYAGVVAQLRRRRKALVDKGGDTAQIDLHRGEVDEAFSVLSDPVRRRRYDAMLALQEQGWTTDSGEVWERVSGALVPPSAAAAAELLRQGTSLALGTLPPAPRPRTAPAHDAGVEQNTVTQPTMVPATSPGDEAEVSPRHASVVPLPTASTEAQQASLRVVDGAPASAPVIVMPTGGRGGSRPLRATDVAAMVREYGFSGALLSAVRDARGLSLQEMSDSSRISVRYLQALEDDDFERLPSATFVRGYVREVARLLELDEDRVVEGYMRRFSGDA
jgi:hypothetical protein